MSTSLIHSADTTRSLKTKSLTAEPDFGRICPGPSVELCICLRREQCPDLPQHGFNNGNSVHHAAFVKMENVSILKHT